MIACDDTEVPLEQLEDYVNDILSVAHEHADNTNIELQFKVCVCVRVHVHVCVCVPDCC